MLNFFLVTRISGNKSIIFVSPSKYPCLCDKSDGERAQKQRAFLVIEKQKKNNTTYYYCRNPCLK